MMITDAHLPWRPLRRGALAAAGSPSSAGAAARFLRLAAGGASASSAAAATAEAAAGSLVAAGFLAAGFLAAGGAAAGGAAAGGAATGGAATGGAVVLRLWYCTQVTMLYSGNHCWYQYSGCCSPE